MSEFGAFPVTQWSLVGRAGNASPEARRDSLGVLMQRYSPALLTHLVYRKRVERHRADDILQGFITDKLIAQEIVAQADQGRGKFRTFLLTALDNYLISNARAASAKKRAPGSGPILDVDEAADAAGPAEKPGASFDIEWARTILNQAIELTKTECEKGNRTDVWIVFDARVIGPTLRGDEPPAYEELSARVGSASPMQLSNLLVTAKRMFARNLRTVVSEYARDEDEIEDELLDLRTILAGG